MYSRPVALEIALIDECLQTSLSPEMFSKLQKSKDTATSKIFSKLQKISNNLFLHIYDYKEMVLRNGVLVRNGPGDILNFFSGIAGHDQGFAEYKKKPPNAIDRQIRAEILSHLPDFKQPLTNSGSDQR